jgi:hypothetical protein
MPNILNPEFDKVQSTYRASTEDVLFQLQEIKNAVSGDGGDPATATNQTAQLNQDYYFDEQVLISLNVFNTAIQNMNINIEDIENTGAKSLKQDTTNALITSLNSAVATATKQIEQINILNGISNYLYRTYVVTKNTNLFFEYGNNYIFYSDSKYKTMFTGVDDSNMRFSKLTVLIFGTGSGNINIKAQFNTNSGAESVEIHMVDEATGNRISNPINLSQRKLITITNHVACDYIFFESIGTTSGQIFVRASGNLNNI